MSIDPYRLPLEEGETAWLGLGSNLGDSAAAVRAAASRLLAATASRPAAASSLYRTSPVGPGLRGPFINAVLGLRCSLSPRDLLRLCRRIEAELGRDRCAGPDRPIDIDILLLGARVIETADLTVPHPRMHSRRFVLEPLAQAAPDIIHPLFARSVSELLTTLEDGSAVTRLNETLLATAADR